MNLTLIVACVLCAMYACVHHCSGVCVNRSVIHWVFNTHNAFKCFWSHAHQYIYSSIHHIPLLHYFNWLNHSNTCHHQLLVYKEIHNKHFTNKQSHTHKQKHTPYIENLSHRRDAIPREPTDVQVQPSWPMVEVTLK